MSNPISVIAGLCIAASAFLVLWNQIRVRKILTHMDRMLDRAIDGTFTTQMIDETMLSAVEFKLGRYLDAAGTSARKLAEEKERIKTLISDISHQTKTPVASLLLYCELLEEQKLDETSAEYAKAACGQAKKLQFLIATLIRMSRLETGILALYPVCADIFPMLEKACAQLAPKAAAKGLSLALLPAEEEEIQACFDEKWTLEAVCNILDNAVKYTESGGSIHVKVTETPGAMSGYANYEFVIKDTGIGMSEDFVKKIFEPFKRELDSTTSGIQGTGLGMAITKNIVEMMGGTISVESEKGVGSEFRVCLTFRINTGEKLVHMSEFENVMSLEEQLAEVPKGRILLAEDVELNQEIAATILGDAGFETEIAGNGRIAVDMLAKSEPGYYQVILMDVQMPVMNGYEATKEIRRMENQVHASIPIIAMTANAFEEDKQEALRSGMNGHIAKPIDMEILFGVLRQILK